MNHLNNITKKPAPAMSTVEFDAMMGMYGRILTAITNTIGLVLVGIGLPNEVIGIKSGSGESSGEEE